MAKTWSEKLAGGKPAEVKPCPKDMAGMRRGQAMLIPSARLIDARIRRIPRGHEMDARALRAALAEEQGAEVFCPITTGILLRIVAEAAREAREAGAPDEAITPVWRVLAGDDTVPQRMTGGPAFVLAGRAREGLPSRRRGTRRK